MTNIRTLTDYFSYYRPPIKNIVPCRSVTLESIYKFITSGALEFATRRVRSGELKKYMVLPFITASGIFTRRRLCELNTYSGIVSFDLDNVDLSFKRKLFEDKFLMPLLIFTSPSGKGLKVFIRVTNSSFAHHDDYFNAVSYYLLAKYGLKADPACRDITRTCFLCHDDDALFSPDGDVRSESLLEMLPAKPQAPDEEALSIITVGSVRDNFPSFFDLGFCSPPPFIDNSAPAEKSPYPDHAASISLLPGPADRRQNSWLTNAADKLNSCPAVHEYALKILQLHGWTSKGQYWIRPGKESGRGHSASWTFYDPYGIWLFTNFSSNARHFFANKAYTDCMVISILSYNADFRKCISELITLFNPLL